MAASGSLCVMAAHPFLLLHAASTCARAGAAAVCRLHSKINSSSKNGALITFRQATRTRTHGRTDGRQRTARTHAVSKCSHRCCSRTAYVVVVAVLAVWYLIPFYFILFTPFVGGCRPHAVLKQPMKFVAGCVLKVSRWLSTKQDTKFNCHLPTVSVFFVCISVCVCNVASAACGAQAKFNVLCRQTIDEGSEPAAH